MNKGKFITLDGVEGAGKSTQIAFVREYLERRGIEIVLTREPGGTEFGESLRQLLLSPDLPPVQANTELLLMFAARNEHIHRKIMPALARGAWVVSDRWTDATYAYQGGGRGLDVAFIAQLERQIVGEFQPDLTLLLDVPVVMGMARVAKRAKKDRIEREALAFFERVRCVYLDRLKQFPQRIKYIDCTQTLKVAQVQISNILATL